MLCSEAILVGNELLWGAVADRNGAELGRRLAMAGCPLVRITVIGDREGEIARLVSEAAGRADLVVVAGGLGPTPDDRTRHAVARAAGAELKLRQGLLEDIEALFRRFGRDMPASNRVQAELPAAAEAIPNPVGTAPGFALEIGRAWVVVLPGVPRELVHLMDAWVMPRLVERFGLGTLVTRTLRLSGVGESRVGEALADLMEPGSNPYVALLAEPGEVRVAITARGSDDAEARALLEPVERMVRERLGKYLFGADDETHPRVALRAARRAGWTVAVVEGFTAGRLAGWLRDAGEPGFAGGWVLGSECPCLEGTGPGVRALALAREAARRFQAGAGVCVAAERELVARAEARAWIAVWSPSGTYARPLPFGMGEEADRLRSCHQALYALRTVALAAREGVTSPPASP